MHKQRQTRTEHLKSMTSPNLSDSTCFQTEESQSAWSNQSANHPTSFVRSKRRTAFSGDAKWTWTGSHDSCVIGVYCLPITSSRCAQPEATQCKDSRQNKDREIKAMGDENQDSITLCRHQKHAPSAKGG
ncbi:hypothetical protein ABVT39_020722 [Epinephelus coioides]